MHVKGTETNLEKVLAKYLQTEGSAGPTSGGLEIVDSRMTVHDADVDQKTRLESAAAKLTVANAVPIRAEVSGSVIAGTQEGKLRAGFQWSTEAGGSGEVKIQADGLAMSSLTPWLRRFGVDVHLTGRAHGQLVCRWGTKERESFVDVDSTLAAEEVTLAAPWLGSDQLRLKKLDLPCRLAVAGPRLRIERAHLACDLGTVSLAGSFDLAKPLVDWLDEGGCAVSADVDLAGLISQLPATLHLQPGTRVTAGRVQLKCTSQKLLHGTAWEGKLLTTALYGTREAKALHWPEPLHFEFRAHKNPSGPPQVEHLRGQSRFLRTRPF